MSNTTTTTTTDTAKPKTFGISESLKNTMGEFRKDFTRSAAVKNAPPVIMSEKEAFECLYKVATDRRFKVVPVMESVEVDGETLELQTLDEDGNPVFETVDLIGEAWEEIKLRDYSGTGDTSPTIEKLIAQVRSYGAKLKLSEAAINAMIAAATAAETPAE